MKLNHAVFIYFRDVSFGAVYHALNGEDDQWFFTENICC